MVLDIGVLLKLSKVAVVRCSFDFRTKSECLLSAYLGPVTNLKRFTLDALTQRAASSWLYMAEITKTTVFIHNATLCVNSFEV